MRTSRDFGVLMTTFRISVVCFLLLLGAGLLLLEVHAQQPSSTVEQAEEYDQGDDEAMPGPAEVAHSATRPLRSLPGMAFYLVAIVALAGGLMVYIGRKVAHPGQITVVPVNVPPEQVPLSQFMRNTTETLSTRGFSQRLDFTVPELPHQMFCRLMSTSRGDHQVMLVEVEAVAKNNLKQFVQYVEFLTVLDNGTKINTNNVAQKQPFVPLPHILVYRYPSVKDPRELFDVHRSDVERARTARGGRIELQAIEDFQSDFCETWNEITAFQSASRVMRKLPNGDYRGTARLVYRALAPVVKTIQDAVTVAATVIVGGMALCLITWQMPGVVHRVGLDGFPFLAGELEALIVLIVALAAGLATGSGGSMVGFLCYAPSFILFGGSPVGLIICGFLSINAGGVGEKLRNLPPRMELPIYKHLSPELYVAIVLLVLAGI